ncbi:MAG: hypothetical protein ACQESR_22130 [Planctomycetota bacterium]
MTLQAWMLANDSARSAPSGYEVLGIAVWVGVAILTVALLILMRTRWGEVRPLSKCVVLSVFAHLLLVLFAYTTHLFESETPVEEEEAIEVAFITSDHPPGESRKAEAPTPWEGLASQEILEPDPVNTKRMEVETEPVTRSDQHRAPEPATDMLPEDTLPVPSPPRETPQRDTPSPEKPAPSKIEAAPIEKPDVKTRPSTPAVETPKPLAPERMDSPTPDPPSSRSRARVELPTEFLSIGSRMQELADVEARSETAEALAGNLDQLSQSDNQALSRKEETGAADEPPPAEEEESAEKQRDLVTLPRRHEVTTAPAAALIKDAVAAMPRRLADGQPLPTPYRMRTIPQDQDVATGLGGTTKAAIAVEAALKWLASEQERDGRWDASRWGSGIEQRIAGHDRQGAGTDADTGITGLVVLAMLSNGQTHLEGIYRQNVQRGLEFLLRSQAEDGNLAGSARLYARMYCHGMALLAMSEALAMTGDARIKPYVERGVGYTVDAQNSTTGGWRYQASDPGDMSQFGWQVMALKSASLAGIDIPRETREGMLEFLQRCEQGRHGGLSGYRSGTSASRPMTAEALVCRYFLDLAPSEDLVDEATDFLMGEVPQAGQPNFYYWYYGALALFQVQGPAWEKWNDAMQRQLLRLQRTDDHVAGSWDPDSVWGSYGGRVYSTAMATLCLEVYYRYLPTTLLSNVPADSLLSR